MNLEEIISKSSELGGKVHSVTHEFGIMYVAEFQNESNASIFFQFLEGNTCSVEYSDTLIVNFFL